MKRLNMEMEQGEASSRLMGGEGPHQPLGLFLQPCASGFGDSLMTYRVKCYNPKRFIPTCDQGNDLLKNNKWRASLDEALSFLEPCKRILAQEDEARSSIDNGFPFRRDKRHILIHGSSSGFLLCTNSSSENMDYIVCNPVTREYVILPKPHRAYNYVALAFKCKGGRGYCSLGEVSYEVIRAAVTRPAMLGTILEIETFSSTTGEWKESCVVSPKPFALKVEEREVPVLEGVVYWKNWRETSMVAYDTANQHVEIINFPPSRVKQCLRRNQIIKSRGKIYCGTAYNTLGVEVWVLHGTEWIMEHSVAWPEMTILTRTLKKHSRVHQIHPHNPNKFLIEFLGRPFWFDLESCELTNNDIDHAGASGFNSFLYEWPECCD